MSRKLEDHKTDSLYTTLNHVHPAIVAVGKQSITYCECAFVAFFALEYAIRRVQVSQDGLKLSGTHQLLVCADYLKYLSRSVCTVKKNTEALLFGSKETGLGVNADKTKYMIISLYQNAG